MGQIADVIDDLESLINSLKLELSPELHVRVLRKELPKISRRLKDIYLKNGGED